MIDLKIRTGLHITPSKENGNLIIETFIYDGFTRYVIARNVLFDYCVYRVVEPSKLLVDRGTELLQCGYDPHIEPEILQTINKIIKEKHLQRVPSTKESWKMINMIRKKNGYAPLPPLPKTMYILDDDGNAPDEIKEAMEMYDYINE